MPPIVLHMVFAHEAAHCWEHPDVKNNMGSYLFGATAPDVRLVTGGEREHTHFYDLNGDSSQSGVAEMLLAYPKLAAVANFNAATRAFVAGYFSHLVVDEVWIADIYRPFFGRASPLGNDPMADIMDRALQYELDRRERVDPATMAQIRDHLAAMNLAHLQIEFLKASDLKEWLDFVIGATHRQPSMDGFLNSAARNLVTRQKVAPQQLALFLSSPEMFWERSITHVPQERLAAFRQKSIARSVQQLREYLVQSPPLGGMKKRGPN